MPLYWLYKKTLALWVRTTVLPEPLDSLGIDATKPICFVMETRSISNLIVLEIQCKKLGLPSPRLTLGEDDLKQWRSVYALYSRKGGNLKSRAKMNSTKKLSGIVEYIKACEGEQDVQFVPAFVMWGRSAEKENSWYKVLFSDSWHIASRFRKFFTILIYGRDIWLKFGQPVSVAAALENHAWQGLDQKLAQQMGDDLYNMRRAILGPDLSNRDILANDILKTSAVKRAIAHEVNINGKKPAKVEQRAKAYVEEIAATYSSSAIKLFHILLNWLWRRIYDGVDVRNIKKLEEATMGNSVVYVPCHRSHIDYLLMSFVLYEQGLVPPHIAAGINLNLPIVGKFLRSSGAFFMRRSFKGNPLYSAVFNEYLHANFVRGVPVEYFVEGGRSRTGRMLKAKQGMLHMTAHSYFRNHDKPMVFVPIYIGYEKLIESKTYVRELSGAKKNRESVFGLIKSFRKIRGSFGKAYVNFGEPIPLADIMDKHNEHWRSEVEERGHRPEWLKSVVNELADTVSERINDAAVVNPINIVAVSLLSMPKRSMGEDELARQIDLYLELLKKVEYSPSQELPDMNGEEVVEYVEKTGLLLRQSHDLGDVLRITPEQSIMMTYFRNNVVHYFALPSLVASCFIAKRELADDVVLKTVKKILPFIKTELTISMDEDDIEQETHKVINVLLDMGLLVRHWHTNELRRPVSTTFKAMQLRVLAQSVKPMLERYYMGVFLLNANKEHPLSAEDFEASMVSFTQRMSMLYDLNSPDYSDKNLFKGFLETLIQNEFVTITDTGHIIANPKLADFTQRTKMILDQQVRHSIHQIIQGDVEEEEDLEGPKLSFMDRLRARRLTKQSKEKNKSKKSEEFKPPK